MLTKLWRLIITLYIFSSPFYTAPVYASPVCVDWPKTRDHSLYIDFDRIRGDYRLTLDQQELWLDQLDDFEKNYSIAAVKSITFFEFLRLGTSLTTQTLKLSLSFSGVPVNKAGLINAAEVATDVASSDSIEEASYRMVAERSGILAKTLSSYSIIKALLDAKEDFKHRKETIRLLQTSSKKLRANLQSARMGLAKTSQQLKDISDYKNYMDGLCNVLPTTEATWFFVGYTLADYIGPPKSYNKIPTRYGYLWIRKDDQYPTNRDAYKKHLKAQYPHTYRNITITNPDSYQYIALYKINTAIKTWEGIELNTDTYKFYRGKTEAIIAQQVAKDTKKFKYLRTQQVQLFDLQKMPAELGQQSNGIYEQAIPKP